MPRNDPYQSFNFLVEIDGLAAAGFCEVSGLGSETAVIEYREGADKVGSARKLPGIHKFSNIVLKRGITADKTLWEWRKKVIDGQTQRANGSIILLDEARQPILRWNFRDGWPAKLEASTLNAKSSEVAIETLEIVHEGLELA